MLNPSDNDSKISDQNTTDQRNQMPSEIENNKFFAALMEQINLLHETNTKICRNLHETKGELFRFVGLIVLFLDWKTKLYFALNFYCTNTLKFSI